MREIDVASLEVALRERITLLDVRELAEYAEGHVPGALAVPMGQLRGFVRSLGPDTPVHLICWSGDRSAAMGEVVEAAGLEAVHVTGGTAAWVLSGRHLVRGL